MLWHKARASRLCTIYSHYCVSEEPLASTAVQLPAPLQQTLQSCHGAPFEALQNAKACRVPRTTPYSTSMSRHLSNCPALPAASCREVRSSPTWSKFILHALHSVTWLGCSLLPKLRMCQRQVLQEDGRIWGAGKEECAGARRGHRRET